MPVREDGRLLYWQARGFDKARAKYINPPVDKASLIVRYGTGAVIVLTEDILSAVRVARVTEAWAVLGTSVSDGMLAALLQSRRPVLIMLDPDAAGQKARSKIRQQIAAAGGDVRIVRAPKDPKLLSKEDIECLINPPATG
jgi:hypothetical protein